MQNWKKPELICISTKDLLCKVKAKASSLPTCEITYAEDHACPELTVGETWGDGSGDGGISIGCGVLAQCIEVGPLFGCNDDNYCSSMAYLLK